VIALSELLEFATAHVPAVPCVELASAATVGAEPGVSPSKSTHAS